MVDQSDIFKVHFDSLNCFPIFVYLKEYLQEITPKDKKLIVFLYIFKYILYYTLSDLFKSEKV